MAPSTHAKLSASGSERWINCPASIRLSEGIAPTTSKYAEEGTAAHALAEMCLRKDGDPRSMIGHKVEGSEVTEEMADAVNVYLTAIKDWKTTLSPITTLAVETKFDLGWLGRPDMSGTNDAMLAEPFGNLVVFDFKYGAGYPVEVVTERGPNPQMMYYALGAAGEMGYETVTLVIVQPRAHHDDGPVRHHTLDIADLMAWGKTVLLPAAEATEKPDAKACVGPWCKFCPALALCPAQHERATALAKQVFAPEQFTPPMRNLPAPELMPVSSMRDVLDKATVVEAWFNACREYVRVGLENGTIKAEDVGHKLVAGRATRKWANDGAAETYLTSWLGQDAYAPKKILSPAQAEKVLGKERHADMAKMVETTRGVQVVPITDKRAAVEPLTNVFKPVQIEEVKE